jgi:hypothetical protein
VDESPDPEYIPHIVVTRPKECWDDQYTPWQNRLDYQWAQHGQLVVPPLNLMTGRMHSPLDPLSLFDGVDTPPPVINSLPQPLSLSLPPKPTVALSTLPWQGMSIPEEVYRRLFEIVV